MLLRFIHVISSINTVSFSLLSSISEHGHVIICPFKVDGDLCCFQFGTILNKAAMYIHTQVFVWTYV